LNKYGKIAKQCWLEIPIHYPNVKMDEFIVMPNHVHGIINIFEKNDASIRNVVGIQNFESLRVNKYQHIIPGSIGAIIRGFKTGVTKWFRKNA
jgi:REP element-mobilizing transposase RayT